MELSRLLEVAHGRVKYGSHVALDDIDLNVSMGQFVVVAGPNGSGKTTLLRAAAGLIPLSTGSIHIGPYDIANETTNAKRLLGFVVAGDQFPAVLTGRECLELFSAARGIPKVPPKTLALSDALSLTRMLDRYVETYSLGMRQKLGILAGLVGDPPLLLLDEPFNGLDPRSSLVFKQYLAQLVLERSAGVVLATHSLDIAEQYASTVVLLLEGRMLKRWGTRELNQFRNGMRGGLEHAMVAACGVP